MTRLVLSICAAILLQACAASRTSSSGQDLISIYFVDQNGISETINNPERLKQYAFVNFLTPQPYQKVMRTYKRGKQGDVRSYLTSYHENGQVKQYLEAQNNRALGVYREWHSNGVMRIDAHVIGGDADLTLPSEDTWLFDGLSRAWDENGCQEADIFYCKGVLEGTSVYYHTNGNVWKKIPFHKGKIEGTYQIYMKSGEPLQVSAYSAGEPNGKTIRYWPGEFLAAEECYDKGKLISGSYYNPEGDLIAEIRDGNGYKALFGQTAVSELHQYRNGLQEGAVQIFTPEGILIKQFHTKDNIKHGEETEYYDPCHVQNAKTPKLSFNWYEGKIQGNVKTWYENGNQESQREYSNNMKNGLCTAWYRDGSLMMMEEYEKDKLIKGEYYKRGDRYPVSQVKEGCGTVTYFDPEGNFLEKAEYYNGMPEE